MSKKFCYGYFHEEYGFDIALKKALGKVLGKVLGKTAENFRIIPRK